MAHLEHQERSREPLQDPEHKGKVVRRGTGMVWRTLADETTKGSLPSSRDFLVAVSREPAGRKERQWLGLNVD